MAQQQRHPRVVFLGVLSTEYQELIKAAIAVLNAIAETLSTLSKGKLFNPNESLQFLVLVEKLKKCGVTNFIFTNVSEKVTAIIDSKIF